MLFSTKGRKRIAVCEISIGQAKGLRCSATVLLVLQGGRGAECVVSYPAELQGGRGWPVVHVPNPLGNRFNLFTLALLPFSSHPATLLTLF